MSSSPDALSPRMWTSSATEFLLNPRMPETLRETLLDAQAAMPVLKGHVWLTTSGSNGIKWVALSKDALLVSAEAVNRHLESSAVDSWALALPVFHVGGLSILARASLSGAGVHHFSDATGNPRWDANAFHAFLHETRATLTSLVPTQLHDLVRMSGAPPPTLRAAVIGGGALSPELYSQARKLGWPVLPSYGLSECCSQVATATLASLECETSGNDAALTLLSHITARISEDGRILLKSPALLTGYGLIGTNAEGDDTPRFVDPKENGWFLTEDRGAVEGNALVIQGRIGDFVKIGGESVDVARLEHLWARIQAANESLLETVLIAAPDTRLGTAIHLITAGESDAQDQVRRSVEAFNLQVLPFERIQRFHHLDRIPRSPLGKVLRTEVLKQIELRIG